MRSEIANDLSVDSRPRVAIVEALHNDWFEIWYQPKVDLKRKCLAGAEALARLHHPEHGILLPGSFIPEVDQKGIAKLAEHTLLAALSDWAMFDEAGFNLHLAVNMPASVLRQRSIPHFVNAHRPKSERWPGLVLEATEEHLVLGLTGDGEPANELQAAGLTIAVDDFGAAPSSLVSLQNLPVTELKIAGGFVTDCAVNAESGAVCQAVVDLAHQMGCVAVADCVENTADMLAMIALGCDLAQGPLITPFLPKQEFLDLLRLRNAPSPTAPKDVIRSGARMIARVA